MQINADTKLKALVAAMAALCVAAVLYESVGRPYLEGYLTETARKARYEGVIKPKGLSPHKALYWTPSK